MSLRTIGVLATGLSLSFLAAGMVAAGAVATLAGAGTTSTPAGPLPSAEARTAIPAPYLQAFQAAAATCPGLPWSVIAGVGRVETDFGADDQTSAAGAIGPMQFLPSTVAVYALPVPPGGAVPPNPYDPLDAIYAAARLLCANGARDGADIPAALYAYNHSEAYVGHVLGYAAIYAGPAPTAGVPGLAAAEAVDYATAQIGTPYRWGGESPGTGFDCSGLTQAAYAAAGITIPRTSEAQWSALPHVPLAQLQPGDLVFFEPGEFIPGLPGHVAIYLGDGKMIDAPHTGSTVRAEELASWPAPLGAARPAALAPASDPG